MKKIFIILMLFLFLTPKVTEASLSNLPYALKFADSIYSGSIPIIKNLKDQKRGSYLPGVFDSKILSFNQVSAGATKQIKKQQEEERRKKREKQMRLSTAEAVYDGRYIDIDLSSQILTIFENRNALYRYKISTGKRSMPTPIGTFSIRSKVLRAYSRRFNLYMPYWMAFTGAGHGIHELPEWKGGLKEGASHLGIPVSHGCIRLGIGAAKTVYDWANIGDIVYVHR